MFARLRERKEPSLDSNGAVPIYSLVRYGDVERAYKEPELFSPCAGLTLDAFDPAGCDAPSRMLETAPPDRHRALRSAMQGAFRGERLEAIRRETEDRFDRFLAAAATGADVEFVTAFARGAATGMMATLLGVDGDAERLVAALAAIGALDFGDSPSSTIRRQTTELRLLRELTRAVRDRREQGRPGGLVGMLLAAEVEGGRLDDHEVALNCFNVAVAGTGASQHTLAGAAAVWAEHPTCLDEVAADPKLGRRLIDETLRWLTPVLHLTRVLTADVEVGGRLLPKGAGVCLWNISANRDEEVFADASSFRPERRPARNLAFGAGPQYCLGAEVMRTQLDAILTGMARQGARFELARPPAWMRSNAIAGVESLSLHVRR